MNKEAYLNALRDALQALSVQERDAAVEFCEEMIIDRMETGMTEEEAVSAMEPPARMAEKLSVDIRQPLKDAQSHPHTAGQAMHETEEAPVHPDQWQKMQLTCDASRLNLIDLQAGNLPIKILLSPDDQVRLTYYTRPRNVYEARVEGDALILREVRTEKKSGLFHFSFHFDLGTLPRVEICLEVPADLMAELRVQTRNGGISMKGPQMLTHVEMGTTNGGVALENVKCISLNAHTTNGGMAASHLETKKALSLTTTNGGTSVSHCRARGSLTVRTSNGGISAGNCTAGEEMNISTTNGGLSVQGLDAAAITLRTSNSRISGSVKGPQSQWKIDSHTTNGKNALPSFQDGEKPLSVHTTNGSIHISFE